ncbi:hypothetical protein C808_02532 [Lachnospiraceae bacterium M18-1]|nr:hypothetical protein C808_02532 [Lachnospiraceae bacterium M18-1]
MKTNHEILSEIPAEKVAEAIVHIFEKIFLRRFPEEEYSNFEQAEDEALVIRWLNMGCKE